MVLSLPAAIILSEPRPLHCKVMLLLESNNLASYLSTIGLETYPYSHVLRSLSYSLSIRLKLMLSSLRLDGKDISEEV